MILFRHAQIYDGTGQKPFLGDVLSCANTVSYTHLTLPTT